MAHFAEIDGSNIVTKVIVVADEHEADGENWCNGFLGGTWKQTSYNTVGNVHALGGTEKYTWIEATQSWELTSGLTMPINYP